MLTRYPEMEPRNVTVKAKIDGKVVKIDAAGDNRNDYDDMEKSGKYEYLGLGIYHSYDGNPAKDKQPIHFWKFK